jgi:hypothetical protein
MFSLKKSVNFEVERTIIKSNLIFNDSVITKYNRAQNAKIIILHLC